MEEIVTGKDKLADIVHEKAPIRYHNVEPLHVVIAEEEVEEEAEEVEASPSE